METIDFGFNVQANIYPAKDENSCRTAEVINLMKGGLENGKNNY